MDSKALPTRDDNLPAAYSAELEKHSLAPLWAALHVLLPNERTTRAVPHHWRWADLLVYLRVGKRLPKSGTEISVHFKKAPGVLFNKESVALDQNVLLPKNISIFF